MLQHPEDLKRLPGLRDEFATKLQVRPCLEHGLNSSQCFATRPPLGTRSNFNVRLVSGKLKSSGLGVQASKVQVSATVSSQVEAVRSGMELVDSAHSNVEAMRDNFRSIDRMCSESASLIDNHQKIRLLSWVHNNLSMTVRDVGQIVDLPKEADKTEELLRDDGALLQVPLPPSIPQPASHHLQPCLCPSLL